MKQPTTTKHFRANVKAIAKARGVAKLAKDAGITRVYLSRIIAGNCNPSISVAIDLAAACGASLGDLLAPQKNIANQA